MQAFKIKGGIKLSGDITPQGAKNEALQIICATLLTSEEVIINNIPDIIDINKLITLLISLGVEVNKIKPNSYSFKAENIDLNYLNSEKFKTEGKSLRGSIMIVGPLLARFGKLDVNLSSLDTNPSKSIKFCTVFKAILSTIYLQNRNNILYQIP